MSTNCDNNCEAVADLHESSVNLIQYSKQINAWVNGGQNETVNIGGVSTPTLRGLAMAIKQLVGVYPDEQTITIDANKKIKVKLKNKGGIKYDANGLYLPLSDSGIIVDADGNLAIDFSKMDDTKFRKMIEEFRKTLRLPKWLEKSTTFYVRKSGNDALKDASGNDIEDKGETEALAFATIQACVDYVTTNYNLDKYNATIDVGPGTFEETLNLGGYQSTTGRVFIKGTEGSDADPATTIKVTNTALMTVTGPRYDVSNLKLWQTVTADLPRFTSGVNVTANAILSLGRFSMKIDYQNAAANAHHRPFTATGMLYLSNGSAMASKITINNYSQGMDAVFYCNGSIQMLGAQTGAEDIICSGACSTFMSVNGGYFSRNTGYSPVIGFAGSMTGKRYTVTNGGRVNTGGTKKVDGVSEYFPGNVAPVAADVEASTYSWYK